MNTNETTPTLPIFTINSAHIITQSYLDVHNDSCPICRISLSEKCVECSNNPDSGDCKSVIGVCNHAYHYHCISVWLKTKKVCPLDNTQWKFLKNKKLINTSHQS